MLNNQLEGAQRVHNMAIGASANVSPSLNPRQIQRDNVRKATRGMKAQQELQAIQRGAELLASQEPSQIASLAMSYGMSQEEMIANISKQTRVQRRQDSRITEMDVMRQMKQAANSLSDASETAELKGVSYLEQPEVDPFGMSQDDSQSYSREERLRYGLIGDEDMSEIEKVQRDEAVVRPDLGTAGVKDAIRTVQDARRNPERTDVTIADFFGGDVLPGSAGLEQRLADSIYFGREQRDAEASQAANMARADREASGFGRNETAEYNTRRAAAEAEAIARDRFTAGGGGAIADEMMARIGRANAGPQGTAELRGGTYIDPRTGTPLAMEEPGNAVFAGSNTPDTNNMLNAPTRETAIDYVARQQPDFKDGGRVYGDYPQVDITGQSTEFAKRVRNSGLVDPSVVPQDVRSIDEFQKAVDAISAITAEKGTRMYRRAEVGDVNTKKMTTKNIQSDPSMVGPAEVMNKLRYTPAQEQAFAQSLYQAEVSRNSGINSNRSAEYFGRGAVAPGPKDAIVFSAAEAINPREGEANVARIQGGQTIEGGDIKAAFRNLSEPGARQPFIGQVEGQAPRVERFVGAGIGNLPTDQIPGALRSQAADREKVKAERQLRKSGKPVSPARIQRAAEGMIDEGTLGRNTVKAQLTKERAVRDNKARNQRAFNIRTRTGAPPSEPRSGPTSVGYGDDLRKVQNDAREQSSDMALSDMIRRRRMGR